MNKKNSAKTRLIIWSLVTLVLVAVLVVGILPVLSRPAEEYHPSRPAAEAPPAAQEVPVEETPGGFGKDETAHLPQVEEPALTETPIPEETAAPVEAPAQTTDPGAGMYEAQNISSIHIDWPSGSVLVQAYNGTSVQFGDDYTGSEAKYTMSYATRNGELSIRFGEGVGLAMLNPPDKNLTVWVPGELLQELEITTASADVTVEAVTAGEIDIETASGEVSLQTLGARDLSVDTASGNVMGGALDVTDMSVDTASGTVALAGVFTEVGVDSASGDVLVRSTQMPMQIECSTVSGGVQLDLPENETFYYQFETVSGSDRISHPGASMRRDSEQVEIETVSGDLSIAVYQ